MITYMGSLQTYTVPTTGTYTITAYGAQGAASNQTSGGPGAEVGGSINLTAGQILDIIVGGQGGRFSEAGGGGGGTFIYLPCASNPLLVAGAAAAKAMHLSVAMAVAARSPRLARTVS
jgi:hypothetical protein